MFKKKTEVIGSKKFVLYITDGLTEHFLNKKSHVITYFYGFRIH